MDQLRAPACTLKLDAFSLYCLGSLRIFILLLQLAVLSQGCWDALYVGRAMCIGCKECVRIEVSVWKAFIIHLQVHFQAHFHPSVPPPPPFPTLPSHALDWSPVFKQTGGFCLWVWPHMVPFDKKIPFTLHLPACGGLSLSMKLNLLPFSAAARISSLCAPPTPNSSPSPCLETGQDLEP